MVRDSDIYVLITMREGGRRFPGIIRWRDNGSYQGWNSVAPDNQVTRDAVAMDISGSQMIVLGRRTTSHTDVNGGYWTARYAIDANGGLTLGAVTTFNNGASIPADIAFERRGLFATASYYIAYTFDYGGTSHSEYRPCIARVNASNQHTPLHCAVFNAGGANHNFAVALHTRGYQSLGGGALTQNEDMYLVADVDRNVARGTGVVKLVNGVADNTFGPGGRRLYGGCAATLPNPVGEGCAPIFQFGSTHHLPIRGAVHADANGVYIAGRTFNQRPSFGGGALPPPTRRPTFMHVATSNGALRSLQQFGNLPSSQFGALVPKPDSNEFTVVGWSSDVDSTDLNQGPKRFMTAHLVPNSDLIFYNGVQPLPQ